MSEEPKHITTPLTDEVIETLHAGDEVLISGTIYTARDAAHKRLIDIIDQGGTLPIPLQGQMIYYVGPAPAKPGQVIGSAGPTTSYRMDAYTPPLIELGLKGMIGKGSRNQAVKDSLIKHKAAYFGAVGGAAALIAQSITAAEIVAYEDLGAEAIRKLTVKDFPVIVINDCHGKDQYLIAKEESKKL